MKAEEEKIRRKKTNERKKGLVSWKCFAWKRMLQWCYQWHYLWKWLPRRRTYTRQFWLQQRERAINDVSVTIPDALFDAFFMQYTRSHCVETFIFNQCAVWICLPLKCNDCSAFPFSLNTTWHSHWHSPMGVCLCKLWKAIILREIYRLPSTLSCVLFSFLC